MPGVFCAGMCIGCQRSAGQGEDQAGGEGRPSRNAGNDGLQDASPDTHAAARGLLSTAAASTMVMANLLLIGCGIVRRDGVAYAT